MELDLKNYEYANLLEKGDLMFTYNKRNLFSRLIYWMSRTKPSDPKISHVLIHIGGWILIEASGGGTKLNHIKHYNEKKYGIFVGVLEGVDSTKMVDYALEQLDTPYAWWQLLWIVLKSKLGILGKSDIQPNATVCSELVMDSAKAGGVEIVDVDPALASPIAIFNSGKVKIKYPNIDLLGT
jgi:cell wall-associated NlpC family hydrolase